MTHELWRCPKCGHGFVTKNMWHSCSNYDLSHHFDGTDPEVRRTYDRFVDAIEANGPVEVIPQKTRIAIMAKVRFAGCVVRRKWLLTTLWLTREAQHATLRRRETLGPSTCVHQFRLDRPEDIDDAFVELIHESYRVGLREHLRPGAR